MKERHLAAPCPDEGGNGQDPLHTGNRAKVRKGHHAWRRLGLVFLVIGIVLVIGRASLPAILRNYVNRTLDRNLLYEGRIGEIQVDLWRGAYSIEDIHISQRSGNVPVPLLSANRVDFSIQWDA